LTEYKANVDIFVFNLFYLIDHWIQIRISTNIKKYDMYLYSFF